MIVGITGSDGFVGWHLRARMHIEGIATELATRSTFADPESLDRFTASADVIVHVAGVNRAATEDQVRQGNESLARDLVASLQRSGRSVPIIYTNSVQSEGTSAYGEGKRAAADLLALHCESVGAAFSDLVLPHVFGEFGRPDYNSAVATFAHALATGTTPSVNPDGALELVHAQDVADQCLSLVTTPARDALRIPGETITVGSVWQLLQDQHQRYVHEFTVPPLATRFELLIFNMLRSHLFLNGHYPQSLTQHRDGRGAFTELCRADCHGQTSISTSLPDITRGDHFHLDKIERFVVVDGDAVIRLRRILTNEVATYTVSGDEPAFVDMPPLTTHNITNVGSGTLTTVFWAADHFDPSTPDTYAEPVEVAS